MKFSLGYRSKRFLDTPQRSAAGAPARLRHLLSATRKHRFVAACLLAFVAHSPARADTAYGQPAADAGGTSARIPARLAEWRAMLEASRFLPDREKLDAVNRFFNRSLVFASDVSTWGTADHWSTPMEVMDRGRGDCEDFAIAKYVSLRMLQVPNERLRLMYVHAQVGPGKPIAHMVLGYFPSGDGEPLLLDNMIDSVRPASMRSDLSAVYSFNTRGLWVGDGRAPVADPAQRLSRWRGLLRRMRIEGMLAWSPSMVAAQSRFKDTVSHS